MGNELKFVLVGKSGHGKSSFIMSFIDEKLDDILNPIGEGQTTRYLSEYNIYNSEKYLAEFVILKSEDFVNRGCEYIDSCFNFQYGNKTVINEIKNSVLKNKTYFHIEEFNCKSKLEEIFDKYINEQSIGALKSKGNISENEKSEFIEKLLKEIYHEIFKEFEEWVSSQGFEINNNKLVIDKRICIDILLKEDKEGFSYSSLIKKAKFEVGLNEEYKELYNKFSIDFITFIDTYGIDQFEIKDKQKLRNTYSNILLKEYSDINSVIFIIKAAKESSVDLPLNISTIFDVRPSTMSYIVYTHMHSENAEKDKGYRSSRDDNSQVYIEIKKALMDSGMSCDNADFRIKTLFDNVYKYDSNFPKEYISSIESIIKYEKRKFIDDTKIDMDLILPEKFNEIFNNDILSNYKEDFEYMPSRTKGALANNLLNEKNRILGFDSSTCGNVGDFSLILFHSIKDHVKDITNFKVCKGFREKQLLALQEIFYKWVDTLLYCKKNVRLSKNVENESDVQCKNCSIKQENNCIVHKLYIERKQEIEKFYYPEKEWLKNVYDFSKLSHTCKTFINNTLKQQFASEFIKLCEEYNSNINRIFIGG